MRICVIKLGFLTLTIADSVFTIVFITLLVNKVLSILLQLAITVIVVVINVAVVILSKIVKSVRWSRWGKNKIVDDTEICQHIIDAQV